MAAEFTIKASPGTDVWRKPPTTDVFNAPRYPPPSTKSTTKSTTSLSAFHSAHLSFLLPPTSTLTQYDQAGLLLSLTAPAASHSATTPSASPPKWLKTGVEIYNGVPRAATVACDSWADWSLATVSGEPGTWVTVEVVNGKDELGKSLWVYQVVGEERIPLREVCWPFGHGGGDAWEITVEAYACRPSKETGEELSVQFKGFEVKWV